MFQVTAHDSKTITKKSIIFLNHVYGGLWGHLICDLEVIIRVEAVPGLLFRVLDLLVAERARCSTGPENACVDNDYSVICRRNKT